jgi:hypothetical protein
MEDGKLGEVKGCSPMPELVSVGFGDLTEALFVKARVR